ncbi:MAG: hypothetical protein IT422_05850 [Pirellulaceae bacterium]|nr:hypothetical protein [Pirellulaceae bacterium]
MSTKNRGDRIQLLQKVVTKHYTPVPAAEDRSLLEQLIYACCLEDVAYDAADEAFHRLQESFFDWNEVRVTTVSELCETLHNLPEPAAAALRIKKNLHSLFETRYSFDIDDMAKLNQGKAIAELEKLAGMTKFVLGYMTQNAIGGHSIPVSKSILQVLLATEIVSPAEAEKGQVPGLERTIPKTKGLAFASCLHQLAVAHATAPGNKETKAIMKEAGAVEPKKAAAPPATPRRDAKSPKATTASGKPNDQKTTDKKSVTKKSAASKTTTKATQPATKSTTKKPASKAPAKTVGKGTTSKKAPPKKPTTKTSPPKGSTKRKPR